MRPLAVLVIVTAVWGVTFVQVKDAVALYPLFAFLAVRFLIASGTLAVPGARRVRTLGRPGLGAALVAGALLASGYALQTAGLERTSVSATGFITGMQTVLTPLLAFALFRLRARRAVWVGIALSTIGLALLAGVHGGSPVGDLLVLGGAAAYALQIVLLERFAPRYDPVAFTLVEMMVVIVILGLLATLVVPNVMRNLGAAEVAKVKSDMRKFGNGFYRRYPDGRVEHIPAEQVCIHTHPNNHEA